MMFPPNIHGAVSPSRLQRIIDCPGSFRITQDTEETSSSYAQEGTMLHAMIENRIAVALGMPRPTIPVKLTTEQDDTLCDCMEYYQNLLSVVQDGKVTLEEEVYLKEFDQCLYQCYGTCDVIIKNDYELHVLDWKFGKGVPVYAKNNDQLYAYAVGAAKNKEQLLKYNKVYIHCIQPRLDSYDLHEITPHDLLTWLDMRVIPGVSRAYTEDAPFNPGHKQCMWCPSKIVCRARHNFANQVAADVFAAHENLHDVNVSIDTLEEVLERASEYETYISDIRKYIQMELTNGKTLTRWKLVAGRSNRRWYDNSVAEEWMLEHGEYDRIYESSLISPARAERRFRAWKKDPEFLALIEKPVGKPTLAHIKDPRQPIEFKTAADKFMEVLEND